MRLGQPFRQTGQDFCENLKVREGRGGDGNEKRKGG